MSMPPVAKATFQSVLINTGSNVLAQAINAYTNEKPFILDTTALLQFATCAIVVSPVTFLWLGNLETVFPGFSVQEKRNLNGNASEAPASELAEKKKDDSSDDDATNEENEDQVQPKHQRGKPKLNVRNTVVKVVVDQTVGSAWYTVLFIVTMGALQGQDYDGIRGQVRDDFWPIMIAGSKLWPFVSLLNFTVVPADKRLLVGNLFGVVWAVYLSLMST